MGPGRLPSQFTTKVKCKANDFKDDAGHERYPLAFFCQWTDITDNSASSQAGQPTKRAGGPMPVLMYVFPPTIKDRHWNVNHHPQSIQMNKGTPRGKGKMLFHPVTTYSSGLHGWQDRRKLEKVSWYLPGGGGAAYMNRDYRPQALQSE